MNRKSLSKMVLILLIGTLLAVTGCGDDDPPGTGGSGGSGGTGGSGGSPPPSACEAAQDNPNDDDDQDGLTNSEECTGRTIFIDTQGFGLESANSNKEERVVTSDPTLADTDEDGLDDSAEQREGTDPQDRDTDGDGLGDAEEVNRWGTFPNSVDTDCDSVTGTGAPGEECNAPANVGRNPDRDLWDAAELKLVDDPDNSGRKVPGLGATSPTENDTDGDGKLDIEELGSTRLNPVVADLPGLKLELDGAFQLYLKVTYTSASGTTTTEEYGETASSSSSTELSQSDSTSTTETSETSDMVGGEVEVSYPPGGGSVKANYSRTWTDSTAETVASEVTNTETTTYGSESTKLNSDSVARSEEEAVSEGRLVMSGRLINTGEFTYNVDDLDIRIKHYDPVANTDRVLGSVDLDEEGFTLRPGESLAFDLNKDDLEPDLVRNYLQNPSVVFFEPTNIKITNRDDLDFDFIDMTLGKTALVIIDNGIADPKKLFIATNVDRTNDGEFAGITLGDALRNAGVDFETRPNQLNEEVFTSIDGVAWEPRGEPAPPLNDPFGAPVPGARRARAFWLLIGNIAPAPDVTKTVLKDQDEDGNPTQVRLVYVRDDDGDGVYDREEFLQGASDNDTDTDDDGLSDFLEIEAGWDVVFTSGARRRVFPHPLVSDFDGDGLTDRQEYDKGTDPRLADTDGDGIGDASDNVQSGCVLEPECSLTGTVENVPYDSGERGFEECSPPDAIGNLASQYSVSVRRQKTYVFTVNALDARFSPVLTLQACGDSANLLTSCRSFPGNVARLCGTGQYEECTVTLSPGEYLLTIVKDSDTGFGNTSHCLAVD